MWGTCGVLVAVVGCTFTQYPLHEASYLPLSLLNSSIPSPSPHSLTILQRGHLDAPVQDSNLSSLGVKQLEQFTHNQVLFVQFICARVYVGE